MYILKFNDMNNYEHLKDIKSFQDISKDIIDISIDIMDYSEYYSESEIKEHMYDTLKEWHRLPEIIEVYRVIGAEDINKIDLQNIGKHWCLYDWNIDYLITNTIDIENDEQDLFIVTALIDQKDIDFVKTIAQNLKYPLEYEVTLTSFDNIKIENIESI